MAAEQSDKQVDSITLEGQFIRELVTHEGWKAAKRMLLNSVALLDSIDTIDLQRPPLEVFEEIRIRANTTKIIVQWLQQVEGEALKAQHDQSLADTRRDEIVSNFE